MTIQALQLELAVQGSDDHILLKETRKVRSSSPLPLVDMLTPLVSDFDIANSRSIENCSVEATRSDPSIPNSGYVTFSLEHQLERRRHVEFAWKQSSSNRIRCTRVAKLATKHKGNHDPPFLRP